MRYIYEVVFEKDGDGFFAAVPDFDGCVAGANTFEETLDKICSVLIMSIENAILEESLPEATFGHAGERVIQLCVEPFASTSTKYTTRGAARLLGVNPSRVRQLVAAGALTASKEGRDLLISASELERYIRDRRPVGRPRNSTAAKSLPTKRSHA